MRRARAQVRCIVVAVCVSRLAAAEPLRRVLLDPGAQPSLSRKVRAEASQAGLAVSVVPARSIATDEDAASALVRDPDAAAVVTLLGARRVGVYVPAPDGSVLEFLSASEADNDTFPLRIVEYLRARLAALPEAGERASLAAASAEPAATQEKPPKPEPAPIPEVAAEPATPSSDLVQSPPRRMRSAEHGFWFEGGAGYGGRPGGLESGWRAAVGARYAFDSFSVGALALLPLTASEFHEGTNAARAESWSYLAKGAIHHHPVTELGLGFGPGLGVVVQQLQGTATPPLESRSDTVVSAALFVHGDVSWAVSPWLRFAFVLETGAVVPRVAVRFDGREVTGTGTWFIDGLLVARLRLGSPGGEQ